MDSDGYVVLGLSRDANASQIRRAYRALTHRFDPDHADPADACHFHHVEQAYAALSDPTARAEHDRALHAEDLAAEGMSTEPPLMEARNLFDDFDRYQPSRESVIRAFVQDYTHKLPKARPVHPVNVELTLSDEQAETGGRVPFRVPAVHRCATCGGSGRTGYFHCDACDGNGVSWSVAGVDVLVPREAPTGLNLPTSLEPLGLSTLYLNVQLRIVPTATLA